MNSFQIKNMEIFEAQKKMNKIKLAGIIVSSLFILTICVLFTIKCFFWKNVNITDKKNEDKIETNIKNINENKLNNDNIKKSTDLNIPTNDLISQNIKDKANSLNYDKLVEKLSNSVVHIKGVYLKDNAIKDRYLLLNALGAEVFPPKKSKFRATCSGFFVSEDGYIVTNHHCTDEAQSISVETKNGNTYTAKTVGYYEGADIAVLKIEPKKENNKTEKFNAVNFANSDNISVGDNIIIIGGPLGYKWSASAGIISGKARDLDRGDNHGDTKHAWGTAGEYIQVDAAVNGGNSGGPAFNINGEVVGVATAGYQFIHGINFILSSNTVKQYLPKLKNGDIIQKGLWGVNVNDLEPNDVKAVGMNKNTGLLIHEIVKNGPADKAGLKRGDIILQVDENEIKDKVSMRDVNSKIFDGSTNKLKINRYGDIKTIKITAKSVKEIEKLEKGEIGIQEWDDGNISYRLLTSKMHNDLHMPYYVKGIIITEIKNNDDPDLLLHVGDIIMQVNNDEITSIEDYQKVIKKLKKNKKHMAMYHVYKPTSETIYVKGSKIG